MTRREQLRDDDLYFALDWIDSYDAGGDGEGDDNINAGAKRRILAFLAGELHRRAARRHKPIVGGK